MKSFFTFFALLFFLWSCSQAPPTLKSVPFEYIQYERSAGCISANIRAIRFASAHPVLEKIQKQLDELLKDNTQTFEQTVDQFVQTGLDCQKELADTVSCCYVMESNLRVIISNNGILSGEVNHYEYSGGAHGTQLLFYFNYDLNTGNSITLDEIVKDKTILKNKVLAELNQRNFQLSNAILNETEEMPSDWPLTTNFLISPQGIVFTYQPYEIVPYSENVVQIMIPFEEIGDQLLLTLP